MTDTTQPLPRIYLVRHGETAWSLTRRHTGRTDVPLTERGEEDARILGTSLKSTVFRHVFSSPLSRARRTCEMLNLSTAMEIDPDLTEWDYGDYEGLRSAEIRQRQPEWNLFVDGCPNGESPQQISDRIDRLVARLRPLRGNIALVAHGHVGRIIAARWIGFSSAQAQRFVLDTTSLSILGYEHNDAQEPAILLLNERRQPRNDAV